MELESTVELMLSAEYTERFKAEYLQTKIRRDKLNDILVKWDAGTLGFEPTCPKSILLQQKRHMDDYIHCLEVRAEVEHVKLG